LTRDFWVALPVLVMRCTAVPAGLRLTRCPADTLSGWTCDHKPAGSLLIERAERQQQVVTNVGGWRNAARMAPHGGMRIDVISQQQPSQAVEKILRNNLSWSRSTWSRKSGKTTGKMLTT
jgi:hypothetical protein